MPRRRTLIAGAIAAIALALAPSAAHADTAVAHIAQAQPGFDDAVPDDPGDASTAGGWRELQWNFVGGGFGIDVEPAWAAVAAAGHPGASGVVVAVLDTGVAYANHGKFRRSPDLAGTRFARGYDFVDDDAYPDDHNGHGTHVASTIAERTNNAIAVTGIAYQATIMPVRVLNSRGEGEANVIARGVRWAADHGADIINLSLEFPGNVRAHEIPRLLKALRYAYDKGVVIVSASGNEAGSTVTYPAKASGVVSVGATTEHGCLSNFSNEGHGLDVVAPGGGGDADVLDDPDCHADDLPGRDIYQMTFLGHDPAKFGLPSGYEGTSMAVPHVSGVLALVIASGVLGPDPSPTQLLERLKSTARDLGTPGVDARYGSGLVSASAATGATATALTPVTTSG
jgi:serine protease